MKIKLKESINIYTILRHKLFLHVKEKDQKIKMTRENYVQE